jgi:hypothetical protein
LKSPNFVSLEGTSDLFKQNASNLDSETNAIYDQVVESSAKKMTLAVVASIVLMLWLADEYPALRFRGDASFSGGPIFGYSIKMRRIPFYRPGEYVYHLRGLPNEEMSLQLYAEGKSDKDRDELTSLGTTLDAVLSDQNGVVCQASGKVRNGQNESIWVLMSGGSEAAFWHWHCVHIPLKSSSSYTLTIRISDVDPNTPKINLLPVLEGGQPELP